MTNRRGFLAGLTSLIIAPPIIEEVAKGRSFLSLYSPTITGWDLGTQEFVVQYELQRIRAVMPRLFDRDDLFFSHVDKQPILYTVEGIMRIPLIIEPKNKA